MIAQIGCGFIGSLFAIELAKRAYAAAELEQSMSFIDPDDVEPRNVVNQAWMPHHVGQNKAVALAQLVEEAFQVERTTMLRVTKENVDQLLGEANLVVCAVDNVETRNLLWNHAIQHGVALLNLGLSQTGSGVVEWTTPTFDNNTFSTPRLAMIPDKELKAWGERVQKLPPCELAGMRGAGLNLALAAAKAVSIYGYGFDPEQHVFKQPADNDLGKITSWIADNMGHRLLEVV